MIDCQKPMEYTSVLVVEDEPRLRELLVSGIREIGFLATAVRSGEDAVKLMEIEPHDIALLDLNLPAMDGLECFEHLRDRWPDTVVIILTAFGTLEAAQRAIRLGVVDFLTKPASLGDIERTLHRAWRLCVSRVDSADADPASTPSEESAPPDSVTNTDTVDSRSTLREVERQHILAVLKRHHGNRAAAAAELGISVRTLYYRLAEYGGDVPFGDGS